MEGKKMDEKRVKASITDPRIKEIVQATFPNYRGRKITITDAPAPKKLDSYWDGGTRYYFAFYCPETRKAHAVHSNHPVFEQNQPRELSTGLPSGMILVEHVIFCGKDCGIRIYVNTDPETQGQVQTNLTGLLT
jgi:hypothetical protein